MEFLFESVLNSASSLALLIEHSGSGAGEEEWVFPKGFLGLVSSSLNRT